MIQTANPIRGGAHTRTVRRMIEQAKIGIKKGTTNIQKSSPRRLVILETSW